MSDTKKNDVSLADKHTTNTNRIQETKQKGISFLRTQRWSKSGQDKYLYSKIDFFHLFPEPRGLFPKVCLTIRILS